jgi:hypothetical protein
MDGMTAALITRIEKAHWTTSAWVMGDAALDRLSGNPPTGLSASAPHQ